jgi:hypothetical protein
MGVEMIADIVISGQDLAFVAGLGLGFLLGLMIGIVDFLGRLK